MKLPKEFEERLKRLETTLPDKLDQYIYVFCNEEDEAGYIINHGVYEGHHTIFREDDESETSFLERVKAEVVERSPKSNVVVISYEECLQLDPKARVTEPQSPADIRYREKEGKRRKERVQREAAAKYPPKKAK